MSTSFPKITRNGKTAVLISRGYGAGWSSWSDDKLKPILCMHADIVTAVEQGDKNKAAEEANRICREMASDTYVCTLGAYGLTIEWVQEGCSFEVREYDGAESLHVIGGGDYLSA